MSCIELSIVGQNCAFIFCLLNVGQPVDQQHRGRFDHNLVVSDMCTLLRIYRSITRARTNGATSYLSFIFLDLIVSN